MAKYYYTITENPISLNAWYSNKHWTVRKKQKDHWFEVFKKAIEDNRPQPMEEYNITLKVNSRHDPSNTITMIKIFEDTLKKLGYIVDDSPKYCKRVTIEPDNTLDNPSFKIILENI